MTKKEERKERLKEEGQSLMELAVSLVILLILLAGIVDIGRMAFHYIAMRDAAQEGVAYGSIYPNHCYAIEDRVRANLVETNGVNVQIMVAERPTNASLVCNYEYWYMTYCIETPPDVACQGNVVEVTVSDPDFPLTMPFIGAILGGQTINLETTIRDTIIRPDCVNPGG